MRLDGWIVRPDTADQRKRGRGSARRTETMAQQLTDLVDQFCNFQRKQRGKTEGGVRTYRWILEQCLIFVRNRYGRLARVTDLTSPTIQEWMDDMAGADLALSTMRVRQSTLSSFCAWLVKREMLTANPVTKLERPPHHREPPKQIPGASIMDALVEAATARRRPRDVAIFLILRYTGMRRESVATLRVHHLDGTWGLRGVRVKGGKTRDIPLPSAVMQFLQAYVERVLGKQIENVGPELPLFWSTWGRRGVGKTRAPMTGKNIWRLRPADRLPGVEAARPQARRGHGSPRAASRPRAGPRTPWACSHRHHPGLCEHQAAPAQARGVVLRGEGFKDVERVKMCTRSVFEEHSDVPKTRSEKP